MRRIRRPCYLEPLGRRYTLKITAQAQLRKRPTVHSWRADETYIKVRSKWT